MLRQASKRLTMSHETLMMLLQRLLALQAGKLARCSKIYRQT
jgi:hypothetical protein